MALDVTGKAIFLSGPMTGTKNNNVAAFCDAHATLKKLGARKVYNPALELLNHPELSELTHERWMIRTLHELTDSRSDDMRPEYDMVVRLPGWQSSDGAMAEHFCARACGIESVPLECVIPPETPTECPSEGL
jgi:hypothetical protein